MPFNGSGTFVLPYNWQTDAANGIDIEADRMQTQDQSIADGLSNCITRDGQGSPVAQINWGNQNLNGVNNLTANSIASQGPITATGAATIQGDVTGNNINITYGNKNRFGDDKFYAQYVGGNPTIYFDKSNEHRVDLNGDVYRFWLHGAIVATLDSNGNVILRGSLTQNGSPS